MGLKTAFLLLVMVFVYKTTTGQVAFERALQAWQQGEIEKSQELIIRVLELNSDMDEAKHLLMKISFVKGNYSNAISLFETILPKYSKYDECVELAVQAFIHQTDIVNASNLAEKYQLPLSSYLSDFKKKPFSVSADSTYIIPFLEEDIIPSKFWPGINGKINGITYPIRFDTGADYLVLGLSAAKKLGITFKYKTKSYHAAKKVTVWHSVIDSVSFEDGPSFTNVPATIMADLGEFIIFGTNILEQFLTTIDYSAHQFVFTPRDNELLKTRHRQMLGTSSASIPFYLWGDHFMFARGSFAGNENLNLFFDSGLILVTELNGKTVQASFTASRESLIKWGFDKKRLRKSQFIPTILSLSVDGLSQENTLLWYDQQLKRDRDFGGVRIDGLISHAWLKNYTWTIDFDRMQYSFSSTSSDW